MKILKIFLILFLTTSPALAYGFNCKLAWWKSRVPDLSLSERTKQVSAGLNAEYTPKTLVELIEKNHPDWNQTKVPAEVTIKWRQQWLSLFTALRDKGQLESVLQSASDREGILIMAAGARVGMKFQSVPNPINLANPRPGFMAKAFRFWQTAEIRIGRPISESAFSGLLRARSRPLSSLEQAQILEAHGFSEHEITLLNTIKAADLIENNL